MNRSALTAGDPTLAAEHAVLLRWVGRLQQRIDRLVTTAHAVIATQDAEILGLRGRLLVARTAALWGLAGTSVGTKTTGLTASTAGVTLWRSSLDTGAGVTAQTVICQTGCVGHAHHWLDATGQCRLDGQPCATLAEGVRQSKIGEN